MGKEKEKYIYVDPAKKQELATDFKTSLVSIRAALNFQTNSKLAQRIRAAAMNRGGIVYDPALRVAATGQNVKVRIIEQAETL